MTAMNNWKRSINTHCYLTSKQSFCVTYSHQNEAPAHTEDSSVCCGNGKWFKYFFLNNNWKLYPTLKLIISTRVLCNFVWYSIWFIVDTNLLGSQYDSVGIITRLQAGIPRNNGSIPGKGRKFVCSKYFRPALGPTELPMRWVREQFPWSKLVGTLS
jgi:hypothetical protein